MKARRGPTTRRLSCRSPASKHHLGTNRPWTACPRTRDGSRRRSRGLCVRTCHIDGVGATACRRRLEDAATDQKWPGGR